MILSEEDRLRLQMARFFNGQGLPQEIVDQIFDDAAILAKKILARWEYARGQVLQTGKVTATSTETASSATSWTTRASAPSARPPPRRCGATP
jgi:hypothetical protein